MPSNPRMSGRSKTAKTWKNNVLKNEISAEVRPSPRAVKKDELKMANPANRKEKAKIKKPRSVILRSDESYPTNIKESGFASICAARNMSSANAPIMIKLFFNNPFSSS